MNTDLRKRAKELLKTIRSRDITEYACEYHGLLMEMRKLEAEKRGHADAYLEAFDAFTYGYLEGQRHEQEKRGKKG